MPPESTDPRLIRAVSWRDVRRADPCVVALGNFDGVHLGHGRILDSLVEESRRQGVAPVVVTFDPHPRYYFKPGEKASLLCTLAEKLELLAAWPVEVIPLAFDRDLAGLEPEAFIMEFLQERLRGKRFLLGQDHRFGKGARGDGNLLKSRVENPATDVIMLEPLVLAGEVVSSSAIRAHLEAGRVVEANRLLGRTFGYSGVVGRGEGRGRGLGFPTANLDIGSTHKAMVAHGVYGASVRIQDRDAPAIANIGVNPTFDGDRVKIEVHLLDFQGDLYGRRLELKLLFQVRPERKFPSVDALKAQVAEDIRGTRARLAGDLD